MVLVRNWSPLLQIFHQIMLRSKKLKLGVIVIDVARRCQSVLDDFEFCVVRYGPRRSSKSILVGTSDAARGVFRIFKLRGILAENFC